MQKYIGFKIPFVTKGYYSNQKGKDKIKGFAYYLFNPNNDFEIYKQFIQIESANFRPTDNDMLKTDYYQSMKNKKSKFNKNIRIDILETIQKRLGYQVDDIYSKDKIRIEIPQEYLNQINLELLKEYKVKRSIDIFTGSNSSGAKKDYTKTNIISIYYEDENEEVSGLNFSNPLNNKEIYAKKNIVLESLNEIKIISFKEFLNLNQKAKEKVYEINITKQPKYLDIINQNINDDTNLLEINNNSFIDFSEVKEIPKENISNLIEEFAIKNDGKTTTNKIETNKIVNKLRQIQKINLLNEFKILAKKHQIQNQLIFNNFIENRNNTTKKEHAHIKPVYLSKQKIETLYEIADSDNCLLLDSEIHKTIDSVNLWFFDVDGFLKKIEGNKIIKKDFKIIDIFLENKNRIKYLDEYKKICLKTHNII